MRELRVWVIARSGNAVLSDITAVQIQYWCVCIAEGTAPYGEVNEISSPHCLHHRFAQRVRSLWGIFWM